LNSTRNGTEMLQRLQGLLADGSPAVRMLRARALGQVHPALAILNDQAGDWKSARGHLLRAVISSPSVQGIPTVFRRVVKHCVGHRIVDWLRGSRLVALVPGQ